LKIQSKAATLSPGTIIKAVADCSSFERDLNVWASKMGKTILECSKNGEIWTARIRV
jgi:TusA-related sulfurtransferase